MHTTIDVIHEKNALAIESHVNVGDDHLNDEECAFVTPPANDCPANGDKTNIEVPSEMESDDQQDGNVEMELAIENHENEDEEHPNDEYCTFCGIGNGGGEFDIIIVSCIFVRLELMRLTNLIVPDPLTTQW
jgi:hypothetical protein